MYNNNALDKYFTNIEHFPTEEFDSLRMFYRTMWGGFGGRPIGPDLMWSAYFNGLLSGKH